ncbi:hypothetical protein TDB9533_04665 [Thalassocella blandensis]|nr:hypothetical protein TDB9533_04665 [Thalassocella blandensis]
MVNLKHPRFFFILNMLLVSCLSMLLVSNSQADPGVNEEQSAWVKLVGEKYGQYPGFEPVLRKPEYPNVLIYGDSISMDYTSGVRASLSEEANVYRIFCNGGDIARVIPAMEKMRKHMAKYWDFQWDVIHFNTGLHDLKYLDGNGLYHTIKGKQVTSQVGYKQGLINVLQYFHQVAPNATLIFATTTPVPANAKGRNEGDAVVYNNIALDVLTAYPQVRINDLYSLVKPKQKDWWRRPGNVHFNKDGVAAQVVQVSAEIKRALQERKVKP